MYLNNKKVLIIRLSALGDTIHTLPLAVALKKQFPSMQLDWVVEDKASEFIWNNPLINKVYEIPKKKWKKSKNIFANICEFFEIILQIRKEKYDYVLDTQQLFKSAFLMGLSGGKSKVTLNDGREFSWIFANKIINTGRKQFDTQYHVVKRNLEFAKYFGCENLDVEFIIPDFSPKYNNEITYLIDNLDKSRKTIVVAPATTWQNKHWTLKGWVDLINEFKHDCNIVVTCSEKERFYVSLILSFIVGGNVLDLSGRTSLADLEYIYKNADVVVSPDSGSAHIAWAARAKAIVSMFFATSAKRTAPFGKNYIPIESKADCSPCMKKKCCQKERINKCTKDIQSVQIINIVKRVLQ